MEHILSGDSIQLETMEDKDFWRVFHKSGDQIWYCELEIPSSEFLTNLGMPTVTIFDRVGWKFKITRTFGKGGKLRDHYYFMLHDNDFRPLWLKTKWIIYSRSKRGINCFWRVINDEIRLFKKSSEQISYKIMNPSLKITAIPQPCTT